MSEFVKSDAPEVGELVIGLVKRVERYGAYLDLLEYPGWEGLVHVSEISLKWIRNIRDYLREDQREVFKVLRVDRGAKQVDASLRRVTQKEREWKMIEWKRRQKLIRILGLLAEKTGRSEEEIYSLIVEPAMRRNLSLYDVFLEIAEDEEIPGWMKLDEGVARQLIQLIKQEMRMRRAVMRGILVLTVPTGNGVEVIRRAAERGMSLAGRGEAVSITTIGPPRYLLRVEAEDEERARQLLERVAAECIRVVEEAGGRGALQTK